MKVFSLGGSVLTENLDLLEEYAAAFNDLDEQVVVVTGAGELKKYIDAVSGNHAERDLVGIKATRLNAAALATEAGAYPEVPETVDELRKAVEQREDVYMGGLTPGYSTDAVAAIAAELFDAELFITSDVAGVYDREPEEPGAELLEEVTVKQLRQLSSGNEAGGHSLVDSTALELMERSHIETYFLYGLPENLAEPKENAGTALRY
ncbi:MAG: UMP kinase [Candidatus Nanohaloarchaea archaeon]